MTIILIKFWKFKMSNFNYLQTIIGCADDLERCHLMFDGLLNKNILNEEELTPFWENLHLRQG